jgi:thymidylate synthase ThyX
MPRVFKEYTEPGFSFKVVTVVPDEIKEGDPFSFEVDLGMLSTCLSRTSMFVDGIIDKIHNTGSNSFYEKVFLGYGHKSAADAIPVAVFVQGISMIAAKLLEECKLMNLQESSTRAINFAKAAFLLAAEEPASREYVEKLRAFYAKVVSVMTEKIAAEQGVDMTSKDPSQTELRQSVRYAALDIAGGYLPAGCATDVGIVMSARPFIDHLSWLDCVPNKEVRALSKVIRLALKERYPGVFKEYTVKEEEMEQDAECRDYRERIVLHEFDQAIVNSLNDWVIGRDSGVEVRLTARPNPNLMPLLPYLKRRPYNPDKSWLSMELNENAAQIMPSCLVKAKLPYLDWRDIQRHRPTIKNIPVLTTYFGPDDFYVDSLDPSLVEEALELIGTACRLAEPLMDPNEVLQAQYFIPMAFAVPVTIEANWDKMAYIIGIRTGQTVRPVLRNTMMVAGDLINHHPLVEETLERYPGLRMEFNKRPNTFQKKRGKATILLTSGDDISRLHE